MKKGFSGPLLATCCLCVLWFGACGDLTGGALTSKPGSGATKEGSLTKSKLGPATAKCPRGVVLKERCTWNCNEQGAHCNTDRICSAGEKVLSKGECQHLDIGKKCGVWHMTVADVSECVKK